MPKLLPTRASIRRRRWPCRHRRRHSPMWRCSIRTRPAGTPLAVLDVDPESPAYGAQIARVECRARATSSTISDGTRAARACAPIRRIRTCSGAIWSCPAALVADPHPRYPARSASSAAGQGDREPTSCSERRATVARTPRTAVPTGSTSTRSAMVRATARAGSSCSIPDIRDQGPVGARARTAVSGLRLLVASRTRHDDHQRVGHAEDGGGRRQPASCSSQASTATRCTSGICTAGGICRSWSSDRSSRWSSNCARRTIRPKPTASSASSRA